MPDTAGKRQKADKADAKNRILNAAYDLFATQGVAQVGVDKVIAKSGCAKASLYNQFGSKQGLAIAFLERREELWTKGWLEAELLARSKEPTERLLSVFDIFDEWFRRTDFEGCAFINVLLETERNSPINRSAAEHLGNIRAILRELAEQATLDDIDAFCQIWHMLMKGSIIAAGEGHRSAARDAKRAAHLILDNWPRAER